MTTPDSSLLSLGAVGGAVLLCLSLSARHWWWWRCALHTWQRVASRSKECPRASGLGPDMTDSRLAELVMVMCVLGDIEI